MINNTNPRDFNKLWNRPGHLIRRLHQIHVAIFLEECEEFNLTPVQFGVLTILYDRAVLDQVTIANQLGVDRNTTADVIRRLERRGLLVRSISLVDKRSKLACINSAGRELVDAAKPYMIRAQERLVSAIDDDELSNVMEIMGKLVLSNNKGSRTRLKLSSELTDAQRKESSFGYFGSEKK
jgi:DNA-binding MarR family transcriptional regulator